MDIEQYCLNVANNFNKLNSISSNILTAAEAICSSLKNGNKVMFCGNGGSAADSQHFAAELMGRFLIDRHPLAAIALTTDTSVLTAISNDYSYDDIFSIQVRGLGKPGDVLVGISTSGNSQNVIRAIDIARELGVFAIGLTGEGGGKMKDSSDFCLHVPSNQTNHIQEMHIAVGHMICGIVEEELCSSNKSLS